MSQSKVMGELTCRFDREAEFARTPVKNRFYMTARQRF
jgi:hypothetical protein